jgi:hypothetical protein
MVCQVNQPAHDAANHAGNHAAQHAANYAACHGFELAPSPSRALPVPGAIHTVLARRLLA